MENENFFIEKGQSSAGQHSEKQGQETGCVPAFPVIFLYYVVGTLFFMSERSERVQILRLKVSAIGKVMLLV